MQKFTLLLLLLFKYIYIKPNARSRIHSHWTGKWFFLWKNFDKISTEPFHMLFSFYFLFFWAIGYCFGQLHRKLNFLFVGWFFVFLFFRAMFATFLTDCCLIHTLQNKWFHVRFHLWFLSMTLHSERLSILSIIAIFLLFSFYLTLMHAICVLFHFLLVLCRSL